jgi:branched-chain amino acid transport system substrate-binding protein
VFNFSRADIGNIINEIRRTNSGCIIIFGKKQAALMLTDQLHNEGIRQRVYARMILPEEKEFSKEDLAVLEGIYLLTAGFVPENSDFARKFSAIYGCKPGAAAAYAYDAVNLLIDEAKQADFDRLRLYETISASDFKGVTGEISFDKRGNLRETGKILRVSNGKLVPVEK